MKHCRLPCCCHWYLASETSLVSAMNCRGADGSRGIEYRMPHSCPLDLASNSSLASPMDCASRHNGQRKIRSQRVMGLLDAECVTKCIETTIYGTDRTKFLALKGRGLLTSCGATGSPRPSTRQTPLSASESTTGFEHTLKISKCIPKDNLRRNCFGPKYMVFEKSPQPHFRDSELFVTSALTGSRLSPVMAMRMLFIQFQLDREPLRCACPAQSIHQLVMNAMNNP